MKKTIISLAILLIAGHLLTESASLFEKIYPAARHVEIDPFWSSSFKMKINLLWIIKFATDDLLWVIVFFVLAKIARKFSYKLFLVSCIFFAYHVFDAFCFWYNYKQWHWVYWGVLICAILCTLVLIIPMKEKSKYKSLI